MEIAVCVDETEPSDGAVNKAVEFAEMADASIVLLHSVQRTVREEGGGVVQEGEDEAINRGQKVLDKHLERARKFSDRELDISTELLPVEDQNVNAVVEHIESNGVQHAFLGHRSLGNRKEELFGSFAKEMINETTVPVTIVTRNAQ